MRLILAGLLLILSSTLCFGGQTDVDIPDTTTLEAPVYIYVLKACSYDAESAKIFQTMRLQYPTYSKQMHEKIKVVQ